MNAGTTGTRTGIKTIKLFPGVYHDRLETALPHGRSRCALVKRLTLAGHREAIEEGLLSALRIVDDRCIIVDDRGTMPKPSDLLQGTLDFLILKTIAVDPLHGWGIAKRILVSSGDVLSVGQGSLYPALHRLEQQGWIKAEWKDSDLGRSAKFYSLTREGRKQLERELQSWRRLSTAVELLIAGT